MRHPGEVRLALGAAARELVVRSDAGVRGPTLQEMAQRATVGLAIARRTANNMTRAGDLRCITGRRKVPYRNKPVAEYLPPDVAQELDAAQPEDAPDFSALASAWK